MLYWPAAAGIVYAAATASPTPLYSKGTSTTTKSCARCLADCQSCSGVVGSDVCSQPDMRRSLPMFRCCTAVLQFHDALYYVVVTIATVVRL